jgi:hypothetical protein
VLVTPEQQIVLRSIHGTQLMQWLPQDVQSLQWGREMRDVSKCTFTLNNILDDSGNAPPIVPWLHWVDIYSTDNPPVLYWSGPLQSITMDQFGTTVNASDVGALLARTRVPITKAWNAVDPSVPALEMWQEMLQFQGVTNVVPIQRLDPWGDHFDCNFKADEKTLDKTMQDLETMGLRWTVVAGVPILGPMPLEPIGSLGQGDFLQQGISLTRDGSKVYNDILLRGPDSIARGRIELLGLNLQTIVTIDNMFGLTNVNRAVQQYARSVGTFKSAIQIPEGAQLDPNVNLDVNQMVPSARFAVSAFGVRLRMELESFQVNVQSGRSSIQVTLNEVPDWTEIGEMLQAGGTSSIQSGTRNTLQSGTGM